VLVDLEGPATARRLRLGTSAERVKDIEVQRLDASPGGRLEVLWPAEPARVQDLLSALAESQPPEGHVVVSCGASATGARRAVDRAESVVLVQRAADRSHGHAERRRQLHVDAIRLDGTPLPLDAGSISVRVPDDPATARSFWAGAGPDILADERCPLGRACRRLARALHGRTVGLALGGGGALGYAHVGLLRVLHKAGIPVDYVSGSSFGALAAGIYAAGGLDSLEELVRRRVRVLAAAIAGVADTAAFTRLADSIAGGLQMSETEIPFYPVGIDVLSGAEVVPARGSVGHGVRCSSGLPGVYAATPYGNTWLVDGGICNNVPASVVWEARASFIIASNPIPTIAAATPPTSSRSLARALKSHTLGRVDHLVRSLYLLMSQAGRDRAALADYVFNLDLQGHDPHAFQAGMEIARAGEEQAEAQIAAIAQAYEAVRGPRP